MYDISCYDEQGNSITQLTQWDIFRVVTLRGLDLDSAPEFHFCNKNSKEALVVKSTFNTATDVITAKIPNILLEEPYPIFVYIYFYPNIEEGKTIATIKLPVRPRQKPSDYQYVENIDYLTAVAIEDDIVRKINSLNLTCKKTDDDDYRFTLFNDDGVEITDCVLPISDIIDDITIKSNSYKLKSEQLENDDFKVSLLNSNGIELSHCNITTSNIEQKIQESITENVKQHNIDIAKLESEIVDTNDEIADLKISTSGESALRFHTNYMLALYPNYSVNEKTYTHYTGDTYGTTIPIPADEYDPEKNTIMVWVNYKVLFTDVDYIITEVGETLYAIVFNQECESGSKIVVQIWNTPSSGTISVLTGSMVAGRATSNTRGTKKSILGFSHPYNLVHIDNDESNRTQYSIDDLYSNENGSIVYIVNSNNTINKETNLPNIVLTDTTYLYGSTTGYNLTMYASYIGKNNTENICTTFSQAESNLMTCQGFWLNNVNYNGAFMMTSRIADNSVVFQESINNESDEYRNYAMYVVYINEDVSSNDFEVENLVSDNTNFDKAIINQYTIGNKGIVILFDDRYNDRSMIETPVTIQTIKVSHPLMTKDNSIAIRYEFKGRKQNI